MFYNISLTTTHDLRFLSLIAGFVIGHHDEEDKKQMISRKGRKQKHGQTRRETATTSTIKMLLIL
jgi:hypothetical protein